MIVTEFHQVIRGFLRRLTLSSLILEGDILGLDFFSTPIRLAIAVALTACIALIASRWISKRNRSNIDLESETISELSSEASQTHIGTPDSEFIIEDAISGNLEDISKVSELLMTSAPSQVVLKLCRRIIRSAEDAQLILGNQALIDSPNANDEPYKPVSMNLGELMASLTERWTGNFKSDDVKFTSHVDDGLPSLLFSDPDILKRILNSLLLNSKTMTEKGRVHLHVTGKNPSDYNWKISIIVADTGRGYPTNFKTSVNQDLANSPANAEELNLLAVQKLVQTISGEMKVHSVEGRGSEIRLTVPVRAAMVMAQPNSSNASTKANVGILNGKRVLIIEDDITSQEVLRTFLTPEGCEIDCIFDGNEALSTLSEKTYDLVLMDVRMEGMDGIKTTQAIRTSRKTYSHIPIIAITADVDPDTNAKCMMAGADLFLNKPVGAKALFEGIRFVMDLGIDMQGAAQGR